ncbi:MAG: hypothetical protein WC479_08240 [Candidatus Izemoplasmatales bacterium]
MADVTEKSRCPKCGLTFISVIKYHEDIDKVQLTCTMCKNTWMVDPITPKTPTKTRAEKFDELVDYVKANERHQ